MDELLDALEMPPAGLARWMRQLDRFCRRHGGGRPYRSLLALIDECRAELERRRAD